MGDFDRVTAVAARHGGDTFDATIDDQWTIGGKPNGGYMLALLGRAALAAVAAKGGEHPHPLAASAHYLKAPSPGPVELHTSTLRIGRSASQVRTSAVQEGVPCIEAVFTVGRLDGDAQPWWVDAPPVEMPPEDRCVRLPPQMPGSTTAATIQRVMETRVDPASLGFADGKPGGHGEFRAWMRFADGRQPDPVSLLLAVDALPPATLDLGSTGWVPTFELTAYIRAIPAPGALVVRQRVRLVQQGMVDEVCDVWDSAGRLVAQGTQLAGVRVPERPALRP
jgi:acyl-coenzyme A thioesterase PaaI-like protein